MAISSVSGAAAILMPMSLCDGIRDIVRSVHDYVMRAIHAIRNCFFGSATPTPTLSNSRVTVPGPQNLVAFYRGRGVNVDGLTLDQIRAWGDGNLETVHTYIQWLFPLMTTSSHNPTGPVLDVPTMQTFRNDPALKNQVITSLQRMLSFYGLQMDPVTRVITRASNFGARAAVWLTPGNHNFLRITRMIESMERLGLPEYSRSLFAIMQNIYQNEGMGIISDYSLSQWRSACPL